MTEFYMQLAAGEPRTGLWCPHCCRPSGCEWPIHWLADDGPLQIGVFRSCNDCGTKLADEVHS